MKARQECTVELGGRGKGYASLVEECTGGEGLERLSWQGPSFVIVTEVWLPAIGRGLWGQGCSKSKG